MRVRRPPFLSFFISLSFVSPTHAALTTELLNHDLVRPRHLTSPPGDDRLYVVEQEGRIEILAPDGQWIGTLFDLADRLPERVFGERGLLGLAFSPSFSTDRLFYVTYTARDWSLRLSRFEASPSGDRAEPDTEEILLDLAKPYDDHNAGHIQFGPDGYLYVGTGDGGGAGDPYNLAQNMTVLFGKILRLDVGGGLGSAYTCPPDNPYATRSAAGENDGTSVARPEIWACGLRNPVSFDFDPEAGDLYLVDVGQGRREEINVQPAASRGGENYGWRRLEGSLCFEPPGDCSSDSLRLPVYEYDHSDPDAPCAVSGGVVYRGPLTALNGHYVFADYCSNRIFSIVWNGGDGYYSLYDWTEGLQPRSGELRSIGKVCRDANENLYFLNQEDGQLFRLAERDEVLGIDEPVAVLTPLIEVASPNPMVGSTTIRVAVPDDATANVAVYNTAGRQVRSLGAALRGTQVLNWDGRDATGLDVAPGVYIVQVATLGRVDRLAITVMQ